MNSSRSATAVLFVALASITYGVYFFRADHFFQGDTIYWFYHRLHSFHEFVLSFSAPDPGGWYRPLTNRTVESVLYPFLGFRPAGYRLALYLLFLADIVAVWLLTVVLTKRQLAGAIAAVFFTLHTVNAYTTYDLSFVPELVYTFFYITAAVAFLHYLAQRGAGRSPALKPIALCCFVVSLCSKESAVTLPITLLIVAWAAGHRLRTVAMDLIPFALVLVAYLWLTLGHLGVASEALASLRTPPAQLETGGYYFMVGPHIATNAATAWAWALNLPVGLLGQWRDMTRMRSIVLWGFAALQMILFVYCIVRRNRQAIVAAVAWFWISALPALPLLGHFLPYYLFLPIAGFAVLVGATWNEFYEFFAKRAPVAAAGVLVLTFTVLSIVCAKSSRSEARNNFLLGASSRIAETSLSDLRQLYPTLPRSSIIFINDQVKPDLPFHQAGGALFKLALDDESLQFRYASQRDAATGATIHLAFRDGHLQAVPAP